MLRCSHAYCCAYSDSGSCRHELGCFHAMASPSPPLQTCSTAPGWCNLSKGTPLTLPTKAHPIHRRWLECYPPPPWQSVCWYRARYLQARERIEQTVLGVCGNGGQHRVGCSMWYRTGPEEVVTQKPCPVTSHVCSIVCARVSARRTQTVN